MAIVNPTLINDKRSMKPFKRVTLSIVAINYTNLLQRNHWKIPHSTRGSITKRIFSDSEGRQSFGSAYQSEETNVSTFVHFFKLSEQQFPFTKRGSRRCSVVENDAAKWEILKLLIIMLKYSLKVNGG